MDEFGNSEDENVVTADYSREAIQKINWDACLTDDVYNVADSVALSRIGPD